MTTQEMDIAKRTSRSNGASAVKNKTILDFGAGRYCTSTKYLRQKGFDNVTPYDLWCGDGDELLDAQALYQSYDVVFASNVLNVQSSLDMFCETLWQIWDALNDGGEFICNYPSSPRKIDLTADEVDHFIAATLGVIPEIVGGTRSAPIWRVRKYSC